MKRLYMGICIALLVSISAFSQSFDKPVAHLRLEKPELITLLQLNIRISLAQSTMGRAPNSSEISAILTSMIDERLIAQAADAAGVSVNDREVDQRVDMIRASYGRDVSDEVFISIIESDLGMGFYEIREQLRRHLQQQKYVYQEKEDLFSTIPAPTQREVQSVYSANIKEFVQPEMILLGHIFFEVPDSDSADPPAAVSVAERVRDDIVAGRSTFSEAVSRYSEDTRSKIYDGKIGYVSIANPQVISLFGNDFMEAAFGLRVGEISPVIVSLVGVHILRVEEHLDARILSLIDPVSPGADMSVSDYIAQQIIAERNEVAYLQAISEITAELRNRSEIRVFEENLPDAG